jgi:hypothetical protein
VTGDGEDNAKDGVELWKEKMTVEIAVGVDEGHLQEFGIQDVPYDIYLPLGGLSGARVT